MSFVFRGTRADLESGFPGLIPERRAVVSFLFYLTLFMLYMLGKKLVIDSIQSQATLSDGMLVIIILLCPSVSILEVGRSIRTHWLFSSRLWLVLGVFLMATSLRMYATCQQLQAQAQAHAAAASGLLGHTEFRLHMPPSIAFATRGRLQGLRLQLALLDREFDDLDYETLRALDSDNNPAAPSMSEEEINALPVHKYKVQSHHMAPSAPQCEGSSLQHASSSAGTSEKKKDSKQDGTPKASEDELTCSVCLEQVNVGELIRSLPCLHQFHANCIDPWLRQQGTCPVCKYRAGSGWQDGGESGMASSYMV